jgi:hypothetical protein
VSELLRRRAAVAGAFVIGIAIVAVIAFAGGGDDEDDGARSPAAPQTLTAAELASAARSLGRPVYWAGPLGERYELTRPAEDRVAVRYLGANTGERGSLTVATYRIDDPIGAIRRAARTDTAKLHRLPRGALAVSDAAQGTNVYLAFPRRPYQIEVYDPQVGRALELVLDGQVRLVR